MAKVLLVALLVSLVACGDDSAEPDATLGDGGADADVGVDSNVDVGPDDAGGDAGCTPGEQCRAAAGPCDVAEICDDTGQCPPDAFADTVCRVAAGPCDVPETCAGDSPECPADVLAEDGAECRAAVDECDLAEVCDGVGALCPDDAFAPFGSTCEAGLTCDGAGACMDLGCDDACGTGNACETGTVDCSTGSPTCVASGLRDPGEVCRPAAGDCDVAEMCSGSDATCPADVFSTAECRPVAGVCDVAEVCSGSSAVCPADVVAAGTVCRPAAAGGCDVPESCDGASVDCPDDTFSPSTAICRPAASECDAAETCSGSDAMCPADQSVVSGTTCTNPFLPGFPCQLWECDGSGSCMNAGDDCTPGLMCCRGGCGSADSDACNL